MLVVIGDRGWCSPLTTPSPRFKGLHSHESSRVDEGVGGCYVDDGGDIH